MYLNTKLKYKTVACTLSVLWDCSGFTKAYFICQKIFAQLILTKPPKLGNIWNTKHPLYKA